jgi:triphosphoribosyl-dephospho-CoA synthetase
MSMQTMQTILWRGATDRSFLRTLLDAPREALQEFDLASHEVDALADRSHGSLADLAATVEAYRRGDPLPSRTTELALAV